MKKLLSLFFLIAIFLVKTNAQVDSPNVVIKIPSSIQIVPVTSLLVKDTAVQLTWRVFDLSRDSTQGCNSYVVLYNRKAKQVFNLNVPIPANIVRNWGTDDTIIDDYILTFLNLTKK
jgi:hypothetical protein